MPMKSAMGSSKTAAEARAKDLLAREASSKGKEVDERTLKVSFKSIVSGSYKGWTRATATASYRNKR